MSLGAGRLRHRVTFQSPVETKDAAGSITVTWQDFASNVPAAIEPLSAREFVAAQSKQSEITARIVIRARAGITPKMRAVHGDKIYAIHGVLPDIDSGREYLTLPVSEGVKRG